MAITIRPFTATDRPRLREITIAAFPEASIDRLLELRHGRLGNDWAERKAAQIDDDCDANPAGIFVAVDAAGAVVGYVTTRLSAASGIGWVPNIAVRPGLQDGGIGRRLLERAIDYFRAAGMTVVRIETLAHNERGNHLYTSLGWVELVRQIHFTLEL